MLQRHAKNPDMQSPQDDPLYLGVGLKATIMSSLCAGEKLAVGTGWGELRIFESSGKLLHVLESSTFRYDSKIAQLYDDVISKISQLDDDTLVAWYDGYLRFDYDIWRISDGELLGSGKDPIFQGFARLESFTDGRVLLVSDTRKVRFQPSQLQLGQWDGTSLTFSKAFQNGAAFELLSVCGSRLLLLESAKVYINRTLKIYEWEAGETTPKLLATVRIRKLADGKMKRYNGILLFVSNNEYLVMASVDNRCFVVHDADRFQQQRIIYFNHRVQWLHLFSTAPICISAHSERNSEANSKDFVFMVHDLSTGELLWEYSIGGSFFSCDILAGGGIAFQIQPSPRRSRRVLIVSPPPHIAEQLARDGVAPGEVQSSSVSPLQSALESARSGKSNAAQLCRDLIDADNCSKSLAEWKSAHQLLLLALDAGDMQATTTFEGKRNWWFLELYSVARKLASSDKCDEFHVMQMCLEEAKQAGVIETTEAVLGDTVLAQEFQDEIRALHRAGIMICKRILDIEDSVQELRESFWRYRNIERTSKLIGIGLQLIPIAGGAAAGVLSAGFEIVDGLSVKDIVDYALGLGNLSDEEVMSFAERVFGRAEKAIAVETMNKLDEVKRRKMEEMVQASGYRIEVLRMLFQNPSSEIVGCEVVGPAILTQGEASSCSPTDEVSVEEIEEGGSCTEEDGTIAGDDGFGEVIPKHTLSETQDNDKPISRGAVLNRAVIEKSSSDDLAKLWTGFILQSSEETAEFLRMCQVIGKVLSEEGISGPMLVLQNGLGREAAEWMEVVVLKALSESEEIDFSFGKRIWARQFVVEIVAACCGNG